MFESRLNRGKASGYAPLDATQRLPNNFLPQIFSGLTVNGIISAQTLAINIISGSSITVYGDTKFNNELSTNVISAATYLNLPSDENTYVTGFTFNLGNYDLTVRQNRNDQYSSLTQSLSILASDLRVTGGTYNPATGVGTFTNNSGGTFDITGFLIGYTDIYVTGGTYNVNTGTLTLHRTDGDIPDITGFTLPFTGGTVNGETKFTNGLLTNTISATTYLNLPNTFFTGGTVNGPTEFTNGLSANTISATTYLNLPVAPFNGGVVSATTSFEAGLSATTISGDTIYGNGGNINDIKIDIFQNSGIDYSSFSLKTKYNTSLGAQTEMGTTIGGLPSGTTVSSLTGKSLVELFDAILFPTLFPTYTIPTITLTGVTTQIVEVGSTFSPNIGLFGVKNNGGAFTQLRILRNGSSIFTDTTLSTGTTTSLPSEYGYADPNNPNIIYQINPNIYSESFVIPAPTFLNTSTTTTYYGDGNYSAGLEKLTNKGSADTRSFAVRSINAPQAASNNFQTTTYTLTGIYPYFYGKSATLPTTQSIADAISGGTATAVLASASGTISIPYNAVDEFIWVAYFSNYSTKTKWYVTAINNGDINNSFITTANVKAVRSPNSFWTNINYKTHWSLYSTTVSTLEYRNT